MLFTADGAAFTPKAVEGVETDVSVEPEHTRVEALTRLALRLEEELLATTWRRLVGAMQVSRRAEEAHTAVQHRGAVYHSPWQHTEQSHT
eukprot:SAG11_NODE_1879_length_4130_cov_3.133466_2_plen_90_part_00